MDGTPELVVRRMAGEALSPGLRAMLAPLRAANSSAKADVTKTGRRSL